MTGIELIAEERQRQIEVEGKLGFWDYDLPEEYENC